MLEMHNQPVRVEGLVNNIIARAALHHPELVIHFEMITPLKMVKADPRRLEQVFENLVTNTSKYAPNSPLWITLKSDDHSMIIEFRDEGPGIPPNHWIRSSGVFIEIQIIQETRGSGLGLYTVIRSSMHIMAKFQ